jgi:DedD protein
VKERLTGAIILVALIVLLVPELLTGPVRSAPRATDAAAAEEAPLRSYTINLADDARARATGAASGPEQPVPLAAVAAIAPPAQEGTPQAAEPAPPASPPASTEAPAKSAPARGAAPREVKSQSARSGAKLTAKAHAGDAAGSADAGAWLVQLGSFASRANAERLAQQVRAAGFHVGVQQGSSGRHLYRVLVGPAHDRAGAAQLAAKLQAAGHSGAVVPH